MINLPEIELIVCSVEMKTGSVKVFLRDIENPTFPKITIDGDPVELAKYLFEKIFNTSADWLSFSHYHARYNHKLILTYIVTVPEELSPIVDGEWRGLKDLGEHHAELVKRSIRL